MSLSKQKQIQPKSIGLYNFSSPAAVVYKDVLYVFYNGAGDDGIWYTWSYYSLIFGRQWSLPIQLRSRGASNLVVAENTNPHAIVYKDTLYVFYNSGKEDKDGGEIYVTTSTNGSFWSKPAPVSTQIASFERITLNTSPTAVIHLGLLHVFWTFAPTHLTLKAQYAIFDGKAWSAAVTINPSNFGIRPATTPAAVVFQGNIHLFYDGSGGDGTWYTTYKQNEWSAPLSLSSYLGGVTYLDGTSPAAFVTEDGAELTILNGGPSDGLWYSITTNGEKWRPPVNMRAVIGTQGLLQGSSSSAVSYHTRPYVFWAGAGEAGLWFTRGEKKGKLLSGEMLHTLPNHYSDNEKGADIQFTHDEASMRQQTNLKAAGLLPTVGEVKRYGWSKALARKYCPDLAKVMALIVALVLTVFVWHFLYLSRRS